MKKSVKNQIRFSDKSSPKLCLKIRLKIYIYDKKHQIRIQKIYAKFLKKIPRISNLLMD